jgi:hypothetical protein
MRRALALLLLFFAAADVDAGDVVLIRHENKLGVRLLAVAYPATLSKDLKSGLTNRIFARVTLMDSAKVLDQRAVEIALRYDLWDERFSIVSTMNEAVVDSRNLANLAEIEAMLGALPLAGLFDIRRLSEGRDYLLRVELLLNPIDREKMRAIRKWVAQNTAPAVGGDQGISVSNAVFNRIFEQYADSDLAAAWRVTLSTAFRVESVKHEAN